MAETKRLIEVAKPTNRKDRNQVEDYFQYLYIKIHNTQPPHMYWNTSVENLNAQIDAMENSLIEQLSLFGDVPAKKSPKAKAAKAQQLDLFSQAETAQFGVVSNPRMDISSGKLGMIIEDIRTEEQKEKAIEEEAKSLTQQMF